MRCAVGSEPMDVFGERVEAIPRRDEAAGPIAGDVHLPADCRHRRESRSPDGLTARVDASVPDPRFIRNALVDPHDRPLVRGRDDSCLGLRRAGRVDRSWGSTRDAWASNSRMFVMLPIVNAAVNRPRSEASRDACIRSWCRPGARWSRRMGRAQGTRRPQRRCRRRAGTSSVLTRSGRNPDAIENLDERGADQITALGDRREPQLDRTIGGRVLGPCDRVPLAADGGREIVSPVLDHQAAGALTMVPSTARTRSSDPNPTRPHPAIARRRIHVHALMIRG